MIDITTCTIFNEIDQQHIMLYAEWFDSSFKLILLKPKVPPFLGEMSAQDINYFSEELSKSPSEYLKETKHAFCGSNPDIQFFFKDEQGQDITESWKFEWKRKKIWTCGRVVLKTIKDISIITEIFNSLSTQYANVKMKLLQIQEENESLRGIEKNLKCDVEIMIKIKENIEKDLCKKFLLILNAKKKKILQLQEELEKYNDKNCPFDVATDESDNSNDACTRKQKINKKRKLCSKKEGLNQKKNSTGKGKSYIKANNALNLSDKDDKSFKTSSCMNLRNCKRKAVKINSSSDDETQSWIDSKHFLKEPFENEDSKISNIKIEENLINGKIGVLMNSSSDSDTNCSIELKVSPDSSFENPIKLGALNLTAEESEEDIFSQGESQKLFA